MAEERYQGDVICMCYYTAVHAVCVYSSHFDEQGASGTIYPLAGFLLFAIHSVLPCFVTQFSTCFNGLA